MNPTNGSSEPVTSMSETSPDGQVASPPLVIKDLQTRFLYPFFFADHKLKEATVALEATTLVGRSGAWTCTTRENFTRKNCSTM